MEGDNVSLSQGNYRWVGERLYSFWKFSRPHTIIGTSLSVVGLCSLALAESGTGFSQFRLWQLLGALGACLAGNVYIVGLNQLEDVEIDKVNKPHLPVAAGEFSFQQGQLIVAVAGSLALLLALLGWPFLLATVGVSLAIGTAYSLPPVRLKRFPFWASFCIFTVRGVIVNLGLFLYFAGGGAIPPEVWALTLFVLGFTLAIAIFKDIPDMEGDRLYNITTFTIKLGAKTVLNLGRWVLTVCYLGVALAGVFWLQGINPVFLGVTHLLALGLMWWRSLKVDLEDKAAVAQFYQFIWKLFFLEYLIFPAGCF
ncbi:MAG: homogentisate phytyltransferase [Oscillatoria sp. Prado101]|jgi:homogentisate phytyltransferase/homogentisate geranylgeranyltransferase|nr:homogentisate phytyltransferase [Oscillatoria sp. Prado101]